MVLVHGIASILHRETIAVIVGSRMFERGEACFKEGRVTAFENAGGELRGTVRPNEAGRAPYTIRIWVRDDGLAYECTCPIGEKRQFCKHAVAIALAHLDNERKEAASGLNVLREALMTVPQPALVSQLVQLARRDPAMSDALKRVALDALSTL
ncbi:MAG: hypothetical protein KF773_04650 [Deltaproteobacteria bacterium]|nr:hypothetical protein [Deltaproteobacteria bacterium]MCW5801020.1 hypothetical protein [Deltaproteobacteria bacterium]